MKHGTFHRLFVVVKLIVLASLAAGCAAAPAIPAAIPVVAPIVAPAVPVVVKTFIIAAPVIVGVTGAVAGSPPSEAQQEAASGKSGAETAVEMAVLTTAPAGATSAWTNTGTQTPTPRKYTVAFINDDEITAQSTAYILLLKMTAEIVWYPSCEPLLANFARYDLYIVDGQMPGLSGPPCAQEIRKLHPESVIIGLSASAEMVQWFNELGFPAVFAADGPKAFLEAVKLLGFF